MDREVDIIILGATGFTGKHAVKTLAMLNKEKEYASLKWGISGRSKEKIQNLLSEIEEWGIDVAKIPVIECDIKNEGSITNVTRRAKVLVNATGPYTLLGEPVVKACIETGTHYVDISAELHFMRTIYRKYNKPAEVANVLIVPGCGYASVPAVAGLIHLERHFKGTLHSVEAYTLLEIPKEAYWPLPWRDHCVLHYGTWQSLVYEMQNMKEYFELKKQTFPELEPLPEEMKRSFFHKHNSRVWIPFPGPDRDIVLMTQAYQHEKRGKRPFHFKIYTSLPLLFHLLFVVPIMFIYYYLCYFNWFCNFLWNYPRFFTFGYVSHKGPSEKTVKEMEFSYTLIGKGWNNGGDLKSAPNKTLTTRVSGCDPGYETTAVTFIFAAITVLKDSARIPKGGVLTSGSAFSDTQLVDRLIKNNFIKFETLKDEKQ